MVQKKKLTAYEEQILWPQNASEYRGFILCDYAPHTARKPAKAGAQVKYNKATNKSVISL